MLLESQSTKDSLSRIVNQMAPNVTLRKDLLQEALLHLWQMEQRRPGQTRSWYLRSCRFHLQHHLAAGRSVDSRKRHNLKVDLSFEESEAVGLPNHGDPDTSFLAQICTRELVSLLSPQLNPRAQAILACLTDGLGTREIARKLRISHPTVSKYRFQIAGLVLRLGIPKPTPGRMRYRDRVKRSNGKKHPSLATPTVNPEASQVDSHTPPDPQPAEMQSRMLSV